MRHLVVLIAVLPSACMTPALSEPTIRVSPYLALYQLRGDSSVQSNGPSPGQIVDNAPQPMRTFGQDHYREDVGVRADIGDGFAGFRVDYYRLDMNTSRKGTLDDDWGNLQQNDEVQLYAAMDELRIGWLEPLIDERTKYRDEPLRLQLAAGGVFAHRDMKLNGRTDDLMRQQQLRLDGDVAYLAVRGRASWQDLSLDIDYSISPELVIAGDFEGVQQDFETRLSYQLANRDITFFGGYRYSTLEAEGGADGLRYQADLVIDGFQLGVSVTF